MKYRHFLIIGIFIITSHFTSIQPHQMLCDTIFDKNYQPTPALLELLSFLDIPHDNTIASIVTATQREQPLGLLRANNKERWELQHLYDTNKQMKMITYCKQLHVIHGIKPTKKHYNYVLIFGATIHSVRFRLAYLIKLWHEGVRWNSLVILTGQRKLDSRVETERDYCNRNNNVLEIQNSWHLTQIPQTEFDMIKMVLNQSVLPSEWNTIPCIIIDTPMQLKNNGPQRPTTEDTIKRWITTQPIPGSILAISSQPFIGYQDKALHTYIPETFSPETVGPSMYESCTTEVLLDALARWLYNSQLYISKISTS